MTEQIKRLSIPRRVELIFAFFRDAAGMKFQSPEQARAHKVTIDREVRRQIENAIRDDRELRQGVTLELTDEELCPACGVPVEGHGTVKAGKWDIRVCAGISGQNLFVIGLDAATALIEQLKEKDERSVKSNADSASA